MKQESRQLKTGQRPLPNRGFAGRGPLAAGMLRLPLGKEEQLFHSNVIKEAVGELIQAKEAKARFQGMIIARAESMIRIGRIAPSRPVLEKPVEQLLVESVLRKSGAYKVRIDKKTPAGTSFTIIPLDGRETKTLPVSRAVLDSDDPEGAIEGRLEALGVIGPESTAEAQKAKTRRFECFSPPSIEKLGVSQEELDARRLTFDGELKGISKENVYHSLSFTYDEETTLQVPAGLSGEDLIAALERRIASKQLGYAPERLRQGGAGFDAIKDPAVRRIAHEIYENVFVEDDAAIPERYAEVVELLRGTSEYHRLVDIRNEGVFTSGEIIALRNACRELDHPARVMVQELHRDQMANEGTLTADGRAQMSGLLRAYGSGTTVCEDALRNLADAYHEVMGGPEKHIWRKESLMRMHFQMMYVLMKAIDSLHRSVSS
ncbi:MAG: hypothetical protein AB1295_03360 [Candidatus Micrarchaeota archaeon]